MAEVLGSYQAHGTHTKFAAVLKDVTTSHAATTTTITVTCTGRHYNNDTHANTVSVESLYGKVTHSGLGSVSPASNVYYPSAVVSVAAGKGKTADGNTLTYTITVPRKASEQTVSNISFILTSTVSDKYSTAVWGSSITVPAATISFSAQNLGNKRFSTSSQTVSFTGASGGSGSYAYTKTSEKNSSNVTTNYFSLSGRTLTIAANTPVGTYKILIKAQDNTTGVTNSATMTVVIIKADGGAVTFNDQNFTKTFSTSAQTMTLSAASGGVGTITYAIQSQKNAAGTAVSNFTLSGTTLTMAANTGPNTYTIVVRATAPGNSNYNSSTKDATIKVTVNKANISPAVTMAGWTYGNTASNPSVSGNPGSGTVTYNYKVSTAADSTYTTTKPSAAGTYTVRASVAATTNYNAGTATTNFTIAKAANPITYAAQSWTPSFSTSAQTKTLNATANAQGTVTYSLVSQKQGSTTITHFSFNTSTRVLTMNASTPPGTYAVVVRATAAGNGNYNSKSVDSTVTVVVSKATPTLSVTGKTGLTYTGSAQALVSAWSVTGGGKVYLGIGSSSTTAPTSWSTNASPTATNAGTYYIWAKADASTNYNAVSQVYKVSVTIAKANISPSVTMANWAYGGTASNPSVSGNSGNGSVTYNYRLKSAADSAYSTTKPSDAGTYTIRASIAATTNYNAGTATKDFSITFTATPAAYSAQYNEAAHSASIKTSAPGTTVSYGTSTSYGYSVTCTNANTNYAMSSVTRTVTGTTTVYYSATKNGYTVTGSTTITISNGTLSITPTAYNAIYNGAAHSASIKCTNAGSVTISYGTSTSYGQTLTATTKGTNYTMANVTRTVPGTTTVYYKASKTYYNDVTGSTTIKITGVPVHTNVSGTWKHGAVYLNINGTWKPATAGYVNVNGTWKSINK